MLINRQSRESVYRGLSSIAVVAVMALGTAGCAGKPLVPFEKSIAPVSFDLSTERGVRDGRGRFREIFCATMEHYGPDSPDYMPCEEALTRVYPEGGKTGEPVPDGKSTSGLAAYMVPGVGYECVKAWLDHESIDLVNNMKAHGYEVGAINVGGLLSSAENARIIRDFVLSQPVENAPGGLILLGYSKGAPDILEALILYPEILSRVKAVVSFAGAVWGTELAKDATQSQLNLISKVPGSHCEPVAEGEDGALVSLLPEVREEFFRQNTLPGNIRYYSVVSFPEPDRISIGLKPMFNKLAHLKDGRNDSQLVFYDQLIPGSTLVTFTNADHWAMAVPVSRQHPLAASTFASKNNFPREAIFEALIRFIDEDLNRED